MTVTSIAVHGWPDHSKYLWNKLGFCSLIIEAWYTVILTKPEHLVLLTCRKNTLKQCFSIQPESQPANAVPPKLKRVCESVESEADPLNYANV